jgi:hypothetical protein
MIDVDLAQLYDVPTYRLNEAVKRNRRRFPSDFMFQLSEKEAEALTFAICDLKERQRWTPYVALRFHRARCRNVIECPQVVKSCSRCALIAGETPAVPVASRIVF